jgi:predicted RND superfamily exporter protein
MLDRLKTAYESTVLDHPRIILALLLLLAGFAAWHSDDFELDASADSLTLEQDQDLEYFRQINRRYATKEFLFVAVRPHGDLLGETSLRHIADLRDALAEVEGVSRVTSLLDVPLLRSPPVPLTQLENNLRTLESPDVDREAARAEISESPIYRNLLVSPDMSVTALQVDLQVDQQYRRLLDTRNELRRTRDEQGLSAEEQARLTRVATEFREYNRDFNERRHQLITQIREVMDQHRGSADLFLGGVPMIADDMITYVANDIVNFGTGVVMFLIGSLAVLFRRLRFVLLPLITCGYTVLVMTGLLGFLHWPVTVISSNFVSLLLILTMSMTLHLIVRYRQYLAQHPELDQKTLVKDATSSLARPCLFAALTTAVAFISLLVSGIRPVIDFGWMMTLGLVTAYCSTFLLFPAILILLPINAADQDKLNRGSFSASMALFTEKHGTLIIITGLLLTLFTATGINRLVVENSFINYFSDSTEIHQGMLLIDQKLGGTTPLDIVFTLQDPPEETGDIDDLWGESEEDELWGDEETTSSATDDRAWFTRDRMEQIRAVHDYLDRLPQTGKVLSMRTMMELAEQFTEGVPLGDLELALLYSRIPDEFRRMVIDPYVSVEENQARITMRIVDSDPSLKRDRLLDQIRTDLVEEVGLQPDQFRLTNMMVLYNNMLQSLFRSQVLTLGTVFVGIMAMFLLLFRSFKLAAIAMAPNLLSACCVLGIMGWAGIPLDMMTITIAAISIGIAVDDTIHYIERFGHEFHRDHNYIATMKRCHASIGKSMFYTSLTIIVGFSILVLSNFIPTIYFGLLTSLAMLVAILGALTLLPRLILMTKPFGPEGKG